MGGACEGGASNLKETRELVVISGKGGTGKTTVTAALAAMLGPLVLADYDVDAANLHLAVGDKRIGGGMFRAGWEPLVDTSGCTGCGRCTDVCRLDAIRDGWIIAPMACEGCGACVLVCPAEVIAMRECIAGEWMVAETAYGPLVHAELGPGRENSGKLVTKVKEEAGEVARDKGLGLILGDGPPGIGCAAIAAVSGADAVLIVTEPSLSGRHDLERAMDLCRRFGATIFVCLNKHDLWPRGTEEITALCTERQVEVLGMIPWDESVAAAARQGTDVAKSGSPEVKQALASLADNLRERMEMGNH